MRVGKQPGGKTANVSTTTAQEMGDLSGLATLRMAIDATTGDFINSCIICETGTSDRRVGLTIKDILMIGALTASDCLLTGHTGSGKTHLAKMMMTALFGSTGYFNKTITPGMSASDFLDIDFMAIQKGEKTLREAMMGAPMTKLPGVVLNEPNRAPELVQSVLIPFCDQELEVEGVPIPLGVDMGDGRRYQFRILTINEGPQYSGIVSLDRAVRDRAVIEVPLDLLPMSNNDVREMFQVRTSAKLAVGDGTGCLNDLLRLHKATATLPVHPLAHELLVYLNGLGNCVRSQTGTKLGITFSPAMCEGCHHAAAGQGMCGAVSKPSPRSLINLQSVARGVAAVRIQQQKEGAERCVTREDVMAAAPLVLYSKLEIHSAWVAKVYQGNKWAAVRAIVQEGDNRLNIFLKKFGDVLHAWANGGQLNDTQRQRFQKYVTESDAWIETWQGAELSGPARKGK